MGIAKTIEPETRFGNLVVISPAEGKHRQRHYNCRCDCGTTKVVCGVSLRNGKTVSCGCRRLAILGESSRTHGLSGTPEFNAYYHMKQRCFNKKCKDYPDYGGRGITMAAEWLGDDGLASFVAHIGLRPTSKHSVDRKDTNGNYEPGNVRWSTSKVQSSNKRCNWLIKIKGEWVVASEAAEILKVPYSSLVNACRGAQGFPKNFPPIEFRRAEKY